MHGNRAATPRHRREARNRRRLRSRQAQPRPPQSSCGVVIPDRKPHGVSVDWPPRPPTAGKPHNFASRPSEAFICDGEDAAIARLNSAKIRSRRCPSYHPRFSGLAIHEAEPTAEKGSGAISQCPPESGGQTRLRSHFGGQIRCHFHASTNFSNDRGCPAQRASPRVRFPADRIWRRRADLSTDNEARHHRTSVLSIEAPIEPMTLGRAKSGGLPLCFDPRRTTVRPP